MATVSFDEAAFTDGILTAMGVGTPPETADRAVFVFADTSVATGSVDDEGIPFDVTQAPTRTAGAEVADVPCAIEFFDAVGQVADLGVLQPTKIKVTLLDAQYELVRGFDHVRIGGDKYHYRKTEPPIGLVTKTIWIVHCTAEDDT